MAITITIFFWFFLVKKFMLSPFRDGPVFLLINCLHRASSVENRDSFQLLLVGEA